MDEVLKICNDLAFALKLALGKANNLAKDNEVKQSELAQRESVIIEKEDNLATRNRAISHIEDIVSMKESSLALMKQAEYLKAKVKEEKETADRVNADTLADIKRQMEALAVEKTRDIESKKELKIAWSELKAKEASYRQDIQNEIKKRIG